MWTKRTIEGELASCEIETPPKDLFQRHLPNGATIIDAGCGFGKWVIYLKQRGHRVVGLDNNELAISKLKRYDPSLEVGMGNILEIQYADNFFDAYISMGVVEHFQEGPAEVLREAHRVLKPGGLIFVSVPTVNVLRMVVSPRVRRAVRGFIGLASVLRSAKGKAQRAAVPGATVNGSSSKRVTYCHFVEYRYTRRELERFVKETGFEVIKTVPHDFYGSGDDAVGLVGDFPFLGARDGVNYRLNVCGKIMSRVLNRISPWIACSSVLCVARSVKQ
jgi:2-polyprenyl-3-methyl-5-hydroxy-6-metoxy-1,4-benzoquinol methylase